MSGIYKAGSDRTHLNRDGQRAVLIYNPETQKLSLMQADVITGSVVTIDHPHREIHEGHMFFVQDTVDQAQSTVYDLIMVTPATAPYMHMNFSVASEKEHNIYIYEGATITNAGTVVTPFNHNRNSSNTPSAVLTYQVNASVGDANIDTPTAAATQLLHRTMGGGPQTGGQVNHDDELVLKAGTIYCFRGVFTVAGWLSYSMSWYEHTSLV